MEKPHPYPLSITPGRDREGERSGIKCKGKYGRYLAEIWIEDENGEWVNVNDLLVEKGFMEYRAY